MEPRHRNSDLQLQIQSLRQDITDLRRRVEALEKENSPGDTGILADIDYHSRADEVRFENADTIYE